MPRLARRPFALMGLAVAALLVHVTDVRAAIVFTSNESTFNSTIASGVTLSTQTFNFGQSFNGTLLGSTLNTAIDSRVLPGLNFSTGSSQSLYLVGSNGNSIINPSATNTNTLLSTNNSNVPINIGFGLPQTAVGLRLLGLNATGSTLAATVVSVFSTTNEFLGSLEVNLPTTGAGQFLGVTTTAGDTIGRITLSTPNSTGNFVNLESIRFQSGVVPEPSSLVMVAIGSIGLTGFAVRRTRRSSY